jgi:hypothetical protein
VIYKSRLRLLGTASEKFILSFGNAITIKLLTELREPFETFVIHSGLLGFWTLSIVRYSKNVSKAKGKLV